MECWHLLREPRQAWKERAHERRAVVLRSFPGSGSNVTPRRINMLLEKKNAVIYGAGGEIGSTVARAFAREGARVFLAGRTLAPIEALAEEITRAGGRAEAAQVDALDQQVIRVMCRRSAGSPDLPKLGEFFRQLAELAGVSREEFEANIVERTLLKRLPKAAEVANAAVLMASDYASAMTAEVANVTCGETVD